MSLKYQRVKQADMSLPAPLRWLTRAFSSITMAVILLTLVAVYGMVASVPIGFLAKGGLYALVVLLTAGLAVVAAYRIAKPRAGESLPAAKLAVAGALVGMGFLAAYFLCLAVSEWTGHHPWFLRHRATIIYRLPYFEMTELQFYSWWPLRVVLLLFVVNLIWATIRRIEFKFMNIGVLSVHGGIVLMAVGSVWYGSRKLEGDTILFRRDLGGPAVSHFYDAVTPAVYFTAPGKGCMIPLNGLPRYNDYDPDRGELDIRLHEHPAFGQAFGPQLRATVRGFLAYAEVGQVWVEAEEKAGDSHDGHAHNPAVRVQIGDASGPADDGGATLVARTPGRRYVEQTDWGLEFLVDATAQRVADLASAFEGTYGLVVEIPARKYRQVLAIEEGKSYTLGDTGYSIQVESIGDYGMNFVTAGYEGARDTRAVVQVTAPPAGEDRQGRTFRRMAMHRYPERSQDFLPEPGNAKVGPMGRRVDPDPSIHMAFLDSSKLQYHLLADSREPEKLRLLARIPGHGPMLVDFPESRFRLPSVQGQESWLHITGRFRHAVQETRPAVTPRSQRLPKDEGTYLHSLLPVDLELVTTGPDGKPGVTWRERLWLAHMRYPLMPDDVHRPVNVEVPGIGRVQVAFSRVRYPLPFSMTLENFEMQPYPGSDIPRDFVSHLKIQDLGADRRGSGDARSEQSRLNNPLVYHGFKLSQTGWDPGDKNDPAHGLKNEQGQFVNQQRYTILGVGNNAGIRVIFIGACLFTLGIPWAFYVKPMLVQRQKRKIQEQVRAREMELQAVKQGI